MEAPPQSRSKKWFYKLLIFTYVFGPVSGIVVAAYLLWERYVFPMDIVLLFSFWVVTSLGVTIGYHRMLTHEGFRASSLVRALFLILGCMAMAGPPLGWAATHIRHHAHSDHDDDPHSPLEGFWHAHFGWILSNDSFRKNAVYAEHLAKDPVNRFVSKTAVLWSLLSLYLPYLIGGWTGLVWGGGVRIFLTNHLTWSVNSVCHLYGKRDFETTDESRNNWVVGILGFGEGWHNNHHAFPRNAFHGMRWYQFDLSGIVIRILERFGLVWEVQRVSHETAQAQKEHGLQMSQAIAVLKSDLAAKIESAREELNQMVLSLPPQKVAAVRFTHENVMRRFADIQRNLEKRRNMKKRALEKRQQEVAELLASAKENIRSLATA